MGLESITAFCSSVGSEKIGDRIGRYKLLRKLGEVGCGIVYLADQEDPVKRQVRARAFYDASFLRGKSFRDR